MIINLTLLLFIFVLSLGMSAFFTYTFMQFARKKKIMAVPIRRSVHKKPIPYLGGLAIYVAFIFSILFAYFIEPSIKMVFSFKFQGLLIAASIIVVIGLIDDIKNMKAHFKLFGQLFAIFVLYMYGYRIEILTHPFLPGSISLPMIISVIVTVLWFLGIINAMNFIDGLDGLATGITFIVCLSLGFSAVYLKSYTTLILLVTLAGATLGFLPYNYFPAKIFLGDTGSMFIGLVLGALALLESQYKSTTVTALLVPFVALAIPIIDVFSAICRRIVGKRSVFKSDKKHIHHRLLTFGLKQNQIVLFLYGVTLYLGLFAFLFVLIPEKYAFLLLGHLALGFYMGVRVLGLFERKMRYQYRLTQRLKKELKNETS